MSYLNNLNSFNYSFGTVLQVQNITPNVSQQSHSYPNKVLKAYNLFLKEKKKIITINADY